MELRSAFPALRFLACIWLILALTGGAWATEQSEGLLNDGKLLATGGVSALEGGGGGGLASWALISGYDTDRSISLQARGTYVTLPNYEIRSFGASAGLYDRLELSFARLYFDTGSTGAALGLGRGFTFREDVLGAKLRLVGDAILDQDSWIPQIAVGMQYKTNDRSAIIRAIGGNSDHGIDYMLSASKLFLAESLLANATLRLTKANQFGILGFGGDRNDAYSAEFEGSLALLLQRWLAVGAEYRTKPSNLGFSREQGAGDLFLAAFVTKHLSVTLAGVELGEIATRRDQNGVYLSIQAGL